jgi:hypothetical protein
LTARRLILLVGAIALIAGIIALLVGVSASGENGSVGCGNAIAGDLSTARDKDNGNLANLPVVNQFVPHTNYVSACNSALSTRRAWSIPLAGVGLLVMGGSLLVRDRQLAR